MFTQFLEAINGMTMTLSSVNKFMKMFDDMLGFFNSKSEILLPMILPIVQHPLRFANPFYLTSYTEYQISNFIKQNKNLLKVPKPNLNQNLNQNNSDKQVKYNLSQTQIT